MQVKLLTSEASFAEMERNAATAALTCRGNADKEHVPSEVLARIIGYGHESVLEHITLTYEVKNISRALLQELARHRHISLSVESTRYTLRRKLKEETLLIDELPDGYKDFAMELAAFAEQNPDMPNDELKYFLPEFWPTNLILTVNIRELRHILKLRSAPQALKEFRELAHALFDAIPEQFKYLLRDCVYDYSLDMQNRRLTVAAPEMYELLKAFVYSTEYDSTITAVLRTKAEEILKQIDGTEAECENLEAEKL